MIYEYRCSSCSHEFEQVQSIKDKPLKKCPSCNKNKLERLISISSGFVRREATTLGQLADRNAKKLGKAEVSERDHKKKEESKTALDQAKIELNRKINKMSESQKRKYIDGN